MSKSFLGSLSEARPVSFRTHAHLPGTPVAKAGGRLVRPDRENIAPSQTDATLGASRSI
ncbi:hypothetical protein CHELA40_50741 [Chelatococcus asaccharovorans]|nr:hypothetical protein CHELA17_20707 [Chelatococcus asaccharovorans]CAH1694102.1 hypothetical protein CHELA40_50741 [Chelatococcus asaccharovorans]